MFFSFWTSFLSLALIGVALATLSTDASVVENVPWFHGKLTVDNSTVALSDAKFYAGLSILVIDCSGTTCPPRSESWSDVTCNAYFNGCNACVSAAESAFTTVIIAFLTQLLSMNNTLQRSSG